MAIYTSVDIETTDQGDIVIEGGDLKIATPVRTMAQALDAAVLTNRGEMISDPSWGSDLVKFRGEPNSSENRRFMELNITETIRQQGLAAMTDLDVDVIPTNIDSVAVLVTVRGQYIDTDPDSDTFGTFILPPDGITQAFTYPFTQGSIERVSTT